MAQARIVLPQTANKGEIIAIKALVRHVMETGHRRDYEGRKIERNIVNRFVVTYAGEEIFRAELFPGVAANPYFSFTTRAIETGVITFTWTDDTGATTVETRTLTVT